MKNPLSKLVVMGDRVLIEPEAGREKTSVGLYLPQTVAEKETVRTGLIVAAGPGMPMPDPNSTGDEPWKQFSPSQQVRYLPMQAQVGDKAIFLQKAAVEIQYNGKTYLVVPQSALLVLYRDAEPDDY